MNQELLLQEYKLQNFFTKILIIVYCFINFHVIFTSLSQILFHFIKGLNYYKYDIFIFRTLQQQIKMHHYQQRNREMDSGSKWQGSMLDLQDDNGYGSHNLLNNLYHSWKLNKVDQAYQKMFMNYLDSLSEKEYEKIIAKEVRLARQGKSSFFQIQAIMNSRKSILNQLSQQLPKLNAKPLVGDHQMERVCSKIDALRKLNLQAAQSIFRLTQQHNKQKNADLALSFYQKFFQNLDEDNQILKQSFLSNMVCFKQSYDPFLLNHHEKMQKNATGKKKSKYIDKLFSMNISYIFRLYKAQHRILQCLAYCQQAQGNTPNLNSERYVKQKQERAKSSTPAGIQPGKSYRRNNSDRLNQNQSAVKKHLDSQRSSVQKKSIKSMDTKVKKLNLNKKKDLSTYPAQIPTPRKQSTATLPRAAKYISQFPLSKKNQFRPQNDMEDQDYLKMYEIKQKSYSKQISLPKNTEYQFYQSPNRTDSEKEISSQNSKKWKFIKLENPEKGQVVLPITHHTPSSHPIQNQLMIRKKKLKYRINYRDSYALDNQKKDSGKLSNQLYYNKQLEQLENRCMRNRDKQLKTVKPQRYISLPNEQPIRERNPRKLGPISSLQKQRYWNSKDNSIVQGENDKYFPSKKYSEIGVGNDIQSQLDQQQRSVPPNYQNFHEQNRGFSRLNNTSPINKKSPYKYYPPQRAVQGISTQTLDEDEPRNIQIAIQTLDPIDTIKMNSIRSKQPQSNTKKPQYQTLNKPFDQKQSRMQQSAILQPHSKLQPFSQSKSYHYPEGQQYNKQPDQPFSYEYQNLRQPDSRLMRKQENYYRQQPNSKQKNLNQKYFSKNRDYQEYDSRNQYPNRNYQQDSQNRIQRDPYRVKQQYQQQNPSRNPQRNQYNSYPQKYQNQQYINQQNPSNSYAKNNYANQQRNFAKELPYQPRKNQNKRQQTPYNTLQQQYKNQQNYYKPHQVQNHEYPSRPFDNQQINQQKPYRSSQEQYQKDYSRPYQQQKDQKNNRTYNTDQFKREIKPEQNRHQQNRMPQRNFQPEQGRYQQDRISERNLQPEQNRYQQDRISERNLQPEQNRYRQQNRISQKSQQSKYQQGRMPQRNFQPESSKYRHQNRVLQKNLQPEQNRYQQDRISERNLQPEQNRYRQQNRISQKSEQSKYQQNRIPQRQRELQRFQNHQDRKDDNPYKPLNDYPKNVQQSRNQSQNEIIKKNNDNSNIKTNSTNDLRASQRQPQQPIKNNLQNATNNNQEKQIAQKKQQQQNKKQSKQNNSQKKEEAKNKNYSIKIKPGKITNTELNQYLANNHLIQQYRLAFNKKDWKQSIESNQSYLTEFFVNDKLGAYGICSCDSQGNVTIEQFGPIKGYLHQKEDLKAIQMCFKKYIEYIQKFSSAPILKAKANLFDFMIKQGFTGRSWQYQRARKKPVPNNNQNTNYLPFLSAQLSNIIFEQPHSDKPLLFSQQIQAFNSENFSLNSNFRQVKKQFINQSKLSGKSQYHDQNPTMTEINEILQKNQCDNYQVNSMLAINNINMIMLKFNSPVTGPFLMNDSFLRFNAKNIFKKVHNQHSFVISKVNFSEKDINCYFGKGFRTTAKFTQLINENIDNEGASQYANVRMFSKQLYGLIQHKSKKGVYGNWQLNLLWNQELHGRIKHNLCQEGQNFGPESFCVGIYSGKTHIISMIITQTDLLG